MCHECILRKEGSQPPRHYFFPDGRDDKHLSDLGHYAVAAWISEELRELGLSEHPEPPDWSDLCAPGLRRLALRIRDVPKEGFANLGKRARRELALLARSTADAVAECRLDTAANQLDDMRRRLAGADTAVGGAALLTPLTAEVNRYRATVVGERCGECAPR